MRTALIAALVTVVSVAEASQPLTPPMRQLYRRVERCTKLSAPEPKIQIAPIALCPQKAGFVCCIAHVSPYKCSYPGGVCKPTGQYLYWLDTVEMPGGCLDALSHEFIHHLLRKKGRAGWQSHAGNVAEWKCQSLRVRAPRK